MPSLASLAFLVASLLVAQVAAVDRTKFRTCHDTGFCRNHRNKQTPTNPASMYHAQPGTAKEVDGHYSIAISPPTGQHLDLNLYFLKGGSVRMRISEHTPRWQPDDLLLPAGLELAPYRHAEKTDLPKDFQQVDPSQFAAFAFETPSLPEYLNLDYYGDEDKNVVIVQYSPFKVYFYRDGVQTIAFNERQLMHFEQTGEQVVVTEDATLSNEERHKGKEVVDYGEDGLAIYSDGTREEKAAAAVVTQASVGETFNGHHDSMPKGPRSVGFDVSFPAAQAVYGLPEHTTPLSLPTTRVGDDGSQPRYSEPYRLYNLDVFEYEVDNTMALYGHIPTMFAHGLHGARPITTGVFLFNPSELFVDVFDTATGAKQSHWLAESGLIDVFFLPGAHGKQAVRQYMSLTGGQAMVPLFSLGYHQCRWNYRDEKDVFSVNAMFEQLDYPYDVLWLDIEHTRGKRYFTWDKALFPHPLDMQRNLSAVGRKLVTIVDPHVKRDNDYPVHRAALAGDLYIKDRAGQVYDGWCWPGASSYLDFTHPKVRAFWVDQFSLRNYAETTLDVYTWNDMNEPSVFNGPEVSMPKDSLSLTGVEHREWHNLYGVYMQMATAQGQVQRSISAVEQPQAEAGPGGGLLDSLAASLRLSEASPSSSSSSSSSSSRVASRADTRRPFVLTRAFWAGSQRYGAMWTGDNTATWEHLRVSLPMLLSINWAGLSFAGSDVGGFFRDSDPELWTRWNQAGAFTPFFRGHAHHDTRRKEPWVSGEPYLSINRAAAALRYSLLPYWYAVMQEAFELGLPALRPLVMEYPHLAALRDVDDAYLVGDALLVHPVTHAAARDVVVRFPHRAGLSGPWYDLQTLRAVAGSDSGSGSGAGVAEVRYPVQLDTLPAFVRPGAVLPRKLRLRRSSQAMAHDPYTLFVAPTADGRATGVVYMDDETSFAYEDGHFAHRRLVWDGRRLACRAVKRHVQPIGYDVRFEQRDDYRPANTVERVVVGGQSRAPVRVVLRGGGGGGGGGQAEEGAEQQTGGQADRDLGFSWDAAAGVLTIKKPDVRMAEDWDLDVIF